MTCLFCFQIFPLSTRPNYVNWSLLLSRVYFSTPHQVAVSPKLMIKCALTCIFIPYFNLQNPMFLLLATISSLEKLMSPIPSSHIFRINPFHLPPTKKVNSTTTLACMLLLVKLSLSI